MKEITISRAVYHEKLYANGDISFSRRISEQFTALQVCCGGYCVYNCILPPFPSTSPLVDWKAAYVSDI